MANISDFTFPSSSGQNDVHCRLWTPDGEARGVVQLVHGVSEHIGRYNDFAVFLTEHGFAVAGDDHLGHGLTAKDVTELGWFAEEDGWDKLVRDEKTLRDLLRERFPGVPMILLGHSMGSFIARTYMGVHPDDFSAHILSGTGHTPPLICRVGRMLARREIKRYGSKYKSQRLQDLAFGGYLKGIENPLGPSDWICRDEQVRKDYYADPLCGFAVTAELMNEMMLGLELIAGSDHMAKMRKTTPVLFIAGDADPVGGWGKGVRTVTKRFADAGMADMTIKIYPGMRHEVLNEIGKDEVWNDVLGWIEKKI